MLALPLFCIGGREPDANTVSEPAIPAARERYYLVSRTAALGDGIEVQLYSREPLQDESLILIDPKGRPIASSRFYRVDEDRLAAFLPVRRTVLTGTHSLSAEGLLTDIEITHKDFKTNEIRLNAKSSAARTDTSPKRKAQSDRLTDVLLSLDVTAPRFTGEYKPPLAETRRTAEFGDRRMIVYSNGKKDTSEHYGTDFGVPTGTPVFASGDGAVVLSENRITTGNTIVVSHFPGVFSLYYHLDALTSAEGESIRTGTLIGRSGNTGISTGPHLHWEFRINGEAVSADWFTSRDPSSLKRVEYAAKP